MQRHDGQVVDQMHMTIGGLRAAVKKSDLDPAFMAGIIFALKRMEQAVELSDC